MKILGRLKNIVKKEDEKLYFKEAAKVCSEENE